MTFPLTIIFMFLVFWRPQEWLLPWLYGWPLLDGIVFVSLLSLMMESDQGQIRFTKSPAVWLSIGLWVATALSHLAHTYFQGMINTVADSFKYCFFLILLLSVLDRPHRIRMVYMVIVAVTVVMAIHCLMQQRVGYGYNGLRPLMNFRPVTGDWERRSYFFGIFGDPNDTGQMLACCIPLVFAIPRRMHPVAWIGCIGVAWLLFQALLSTHSRGGMLAFVATVATMVMIRLPARWLPYLAIAGLLAGLGICLVKGSAFFDASARERIVFWGLANQEFKKAPIFGLGYGMFWQVAGDRAAHNAFVTCYTEVGLLGYWFWFSLLQFGVIGCWRTMRAFHRPKTEVQRYLKRAAGLSIAAMVGFSAGAYFLSRAFVFPIFFLFAILSSIPLIAQRHLPEDHPPLQNVATDIWGLGTLSTIGSVIYIYVTILILNKGYYG